LRPNARFVWAGLVGVEQRAAIIEAEAFVGCPARPFGAYQRMRAAPVDQPATQGMLTRRRQPDGAAQPTSCRYFGERISETTHRSCSGPTLPEKSNVPLTRRHMRL